MKIIADMADPGFLRKRVIELLSEGDLIENEKMAINLLALAIYYNTKLGTPQKRK